MKGADWAISRKTLVTNSQIHFVRKNGIIYAPSIADSGFWAKYLEVFDKVYVIARVEDDNSKDISHYVVSSCKNVDFIELPEFIGPKQYISYYFKIGRIMKKIARADGISCAIIRSPNSIGYRFLRYWNKTGKPYGLEIVANYSDRYYYSMGIFKSILYGFMHIQTRRLAKKATAVSYVTENVLQSVYPTKGKSISCSDIDLPQDYYYKRNKSECSKDKCVLIHVSTLEMDSKGHEQFLLVQKRLRDEGYNVTSVIVGGGRYKKKYIERARELGISDYVRFTGHLGTKEAIRNELIHADIFLFPTETEGLPRVIIEAMACSLPCVSTDIPTIKELLEGKWLCGTNDINGIFLRVKELIDFGTEYGKCANANIKKASQYEYSALKEKRRAFYRSLLGNKNRGY